MIRQVSRRMAVSWSMIRVVSPTAKEGSDSRMESSTTPEESVMVMTGSSKSSFTGGILPRAWESRR